MAPARVAAATSTLSRPTPALPITTSLFADRNSAASTFVWLRTINARNSASWVASAPGSRHRSGWNVTSKRDDNASTALPRMSSAINTSGITEPHRRRPPKADRSYLKPRSSQPNIAKSIVGILASSKSLLGNLSLQLSGLGLSASPRIGGFNPWGMPSSQNLRPATDNPHYEIPPIDTCVVSRKASRPSVPNSRPHPLCLTPPNGQVLTLGAPSLMPRVPQREY